MSDEIPKPGAPLPSPNHPSETSPSGTRRPQPFDDQAKDLVFAFRQLLKHKGSSFLAIAVLALGIGGATAVFSVADKVLLHPIPGKNSARLVAIREFDAKHESRWNVSPPLIEELATHSNLIEAVTWYFQGYDEKKLKLDEKVLKLTGIKVAPNFFDLLEIKPLFGRLFPAGEEARDAGESILLSEGLWRSLYGGDPGVIGRHITLDEKIYLIVGVMPAHVQFPCGGGYDQFRISHPFASEEINSESATMNRVWATLARPRPGMRLSLLQSLMDTVAARRERLPANADGRWVVTAKPAGENLAGQELSLTIWRLLAMMSALLLIACGNVGSLLVSRALARRGEFSVRLALGAGRLRLARQLLVENLLLAVVSAALGLFVAWGGVIATKQFYLTNLPRVNTVGLDWKVLGLTCALSTLAGLLFGAAPAWLAARTNLNQALKDSAPQQSGGPLQRLFHDGLIVSQVGLAVVLLAGAGLMTQSVVRLLRVDPGFQPKGLFRVYYNTLDFMNHPPYNYQAAIRRGVPRKQAAMEAFQAHIENNLMFQRLAFEQLRALPGVESFAYGYGPGFTDYELEGRHGRAYLGSTDINVVEGDYLRTVGAKLLKGRLLTKEDAAQGQRSVVINDCMATVCWPGEDPLGKQFHDLLLPAVDRHLQRPFPVFALGVGVGPGSEQDRYLLLGAPVNCDVQWSTIPAASLMDATDSSPGELRQIRVFT